jgi:DNA replicative helicase MCM subunit Mcm2 (Cdc46/Mcm family)
VHQGANKATSEAAAAEEEEAFFRRYIHYARTACFPRLTDAGKRELQAKYVGIREMVR